MTHSVISEELLRTGEAPASTTAPSGESPDVRVRVPTTGDLDRRALMNGLVLAAAEALAVWLTAGLVLHLTVHHLDRLPWQLGFTATWLTAATLIRSYPGYGLDASERLRRTVIPAVAAFPTLVGAVLAGGLGAGAAALLLVLGLVLGIPAALVARIGARWLLHRVGAWGVDVAVIGHGEAAALLMQTLRSDWSLGYHPVADGQANVAILAVPNIPYAVRDRLLDGPLALFRRVLVMVSQPASDSRWAGSHHLGSFSVLEARRRHLEPGDLRQKRVFDLLVVALLFPVLTPLLLLVGLAVALDSRGPVLYGAPRMGWRGGSFRCWKFRTMHENAEARLADLLEQDAEARAYYETYHKLKDDPRVTRVGHFLRSTSLDELPQLINVLLGDMSLVGPRPYLARERPKIGPHADVILSCRPGMTGWWQVSGRSGTSFQNRVQMDLQYVRRWSPWLDLTLLAATVHVVLRRKGAH
ncbi:exopolysaccharide biosynthesis polyprenyl glycosylphosphotransferase [Deinococcus planocerae]|uniref:exopolysaccharide biosynthesis polyprenyl glycosylphosphotransferase n=1 Tax=Deinococcus planocerae TaxID=1737569 RepID=UPI0015E073A1|nr:exopolysaccharide biosynthesis polyprenyl glycosylphosphotransferase [Deinococcus planocerae]